MSIKKDFQCVDIAKLICALLVVFTHTYCYDGGVIGFWIRDHLSSIGVPFFFIVSGYFYANGLSRASNKETYFKQYLLRLGKMYVLWSIITMFVTWQNIQTAHPEWPLWLLILSMPRSFFLVGSCGAYWYILSLLYDSVILFLADRYRKEKLIFLIGIIGFIIGVMYQSGVLNDTVLYTIIHVFFGSERNFINVGLFYVSIGYAMKDISFSGKWKWAFFLMVVSIICGTIMEKLTSLRFMHALTAFGLFVLSMNIPISMDVKITRNLRKLSTVIYLVHFPFILLFDRYLKKGTCLDFTLSIVFCVCCYLVMEYVLPKKWSELLLGK